VPKVFGMHEIELHPGVEPEDYERFFAEELAPDAQASGMEDPSSKGDRGARGGKYLVLHEIASLDAGDRYFPGPGEQSEDFTRFLDSTQKQRRHWRIGRGIAQSNRKTTLRPITSPSLNSAFYSYPGTRDTAGRLLYLLAPAGRRTLHHTLADHIW
jgi:hypothetical protein